VLSIACFADLPCFLPGSCLTCFCIASTHAEYLLAFNLFTKFLFSV
jgi:hypothetical protein